MTEAHAIDRAAGYLAKAQRPDGSWADADPFVCARATYALKAAGGPGEVRDAGIGCLERLQGDDGRFPAKSGMYTDAACTAYALVVLNKFSYSKASLPASRGILWLLEHQNADGSWSGRNTQKNAYTTSLCLRALHAYHLDGIERYRKGVALVLDKLAGPDFFDGPVSHVYAPVLNLRRIGQLPAAAIDAFLHFADDRAIDAVHEGRIADIAYLAGTLDALGEVETRDICREFLADVQNDDGGFGKESGGASDPNWTALVVLALTGSL
ncbi:MAG TPA: prenyltransferase/squalene oxidase repeat-containing protein [Methanocella sp.]|nr:prenyltransferase/squalene oxidase repeat-containing protein [Methanocella sp.]